MISTSFPYRKRLHPWCVIRQLPNAQQMIVARFRRRGDAEAHHRALQRIMPDLVHQIIFDQ